MRTWIGALGCAAALLTTGCSAEWWTGKTTMRTELRGPGVFPFCFVDTKDNDIELTDVTYDPNTHAGRIGKLTVRNNASDPIRAEIERIRASNEGMVSQVAYMTGMMNGFAQLIGAAGRAVPGFSWLGPRPAAGGSVSLPTPWGSLGMTQNPQAPWVVPPGPASPTTQTAPAAPAAPQP